MKLYFLGTGAGSPSIGRNVSAVLLDLLQERGSLWLFDCGEATQHQMMKSPYAPRKLEKIFISHLHGDHLFGLPGLLGSRSMQGADTPLTVYGPPGLRQYIEVSLNVSYSHLIYPLKIIEIEQASTLFDDGTFRVDCRHLHHVVPSLGFRISEHNPPGALDVNALTAIGIPPGPLYARLKRGETITLPTGRQINGNDYLLPAKPGRIVAMMGDTAYCPASIELAHGADVLVHEATFAEDARQSAEQYGHSCIIDTATIAARAQVRQLIMTHLSARYRAESLPALLADAQTVFPNTIIAEDLMSFTVTRRS